MSYWTVPPMWTGRTVAVLASGPSMSQIVADSVSHLPRIVINTTYKLARDADILYACDAAWWKANPEALECSGLKVCMEPLPGVHPVVPESVRVLRNSGVVGFDPHPAYLRTLGNSGAQALQIAVHAGAARILLLGFDMQGGHWHADHPKPLRNSSAQQHARCIVRLRELAPELKCRDVSVINCTPGSALDCFPRAALDEIMREPAREAA